jgi:hypothetical protein
MLTNSKAVAENCATELTTAPLFGGGRNKLAGHYLFKNTTGEIVWSNIECG